ncbi:MAG: VWA domain-containing protein [Hyphomicrobiales bacterium]|nr:VWA domain-containing protein [Hyphomicrobiales bacterium]
MPEKQRSRLRFAALAAAVVAANAGAAAAQTVFIIDSSHSMWGQLGGVNKIVSAREAVKRSLRAAEGGASSAIIAFGATKPAGCDDVQVLKQPGPADASDAGIIDGLKPKGSAPIAAALERAQSLLSPSQPGSVILLADGPDNCKGDPCAVAAALAAKFPNVAANVLAFDARAKETMAGLACVAQATGGQFIAAANEAELDAGLEKIMAAAPKAGFNASRPAPFSQVAAPGAAGLSAVDGATPSAPPPRTGAPGRIALAAYLAQGSPPINVGVKWRVYDAQPTEDGAYKLLQSLTDAQPAFDIAPGEYLVTAAYGRANLTKKIAVWPGQPVADAFVLNAGGLRLAALLPNGQPIPDNQVRFEILSGATDQFGNRERVIEGVRTGVIIRLNSGYYHVVSVYGDANARIESDVAVEPGKLTEAVVKHDAAKIGFRLVRRAGGEALADTKWTIQTAAGVLVKETAGAFPAHILAPGEYRVTATHQEQDFTMDFSVAPGSPQQIEVVAPE